MLKKAALILIPILIVLLAGIFLFKNKFFPKEEATITASPTPASAFVLPTEEEKEIEVSLTSRYDKKAVILRLSKISADVISVEYELSYEAKGGLPKGVLGKVDIKGETLLREILLGTCSKNVCTYDEGVTKVKLVLKFNKSSGKSTGFSQEYEL